MTPEIDSREGTFIVTKEHRRFVEFANTVRKHHYIGLCFGAAGVGKTMSARRCANWHCAEPLLLEWGEREPSDTKVYAALAHSRTVFYTPSFRETLGALRKDLHRLIGRVNDCIALHLVSQKEDKVAEISDFLELVIVDEAERLSTAALDYLRDMFDRSDIGLILIGMPGIEKRMARYPQLYSRVGFTPFTTAHCKGRSCVSF